MANESQIEFLVTEKMINDFADLTLDYNPLHVDFEFGVRSAYRRNIAHGMIGIAHLAKVKMCWKPGKEASISKISANFHKPVFAGEVLIFSVAEKKSSDTSADFKFSISNKESKTIITKGSFTLHYSEKVSAALDTSTVIQKKREKAEVFFIDDISEGDRSEFSFENNLQKKNELLRFISEDDKLISSFNLSPLLSVLALSSYVGMKVPGQNAAFLGFNVTFLSSLDLVQLNWNGFVSLKSEATSSISQDLELKAGSEKILAKAQINCRVQRKNPIMMSAKDIVESVRKDSYKDEVVIVTGAARGLGETISKLLAANGMKIIINYNSSKGAADSLVKEIAEAGGNAIAYQANVAIKEQVQGMIDFTMKHFGRIDVLVNNAVGDALACPFLEQSWEDVQREVDVSLKGAFNLCQAVIPIMKDQNKGSIINISTTYTDSPPALMYKYVLIKSALVGMTRSLAVEFAPYNIRVNAVAPSIMETDLTQHVPLDYLESSKANTPMGRNVLPLEVAKSVLFLASDMSSFTTGQRIVVSGGNSPLL